MEERITIPMAEYKELLQIKGKYEEVIRREESYGKQIKRNLEAEDKISEFTKGELKITC